eukprot:354565-Chlamydomonas_euryale.AAC.8
MNAAHTEPSVDAPSANSHTVSRTSSATSTSVHKKRATKIERRTTRRAHIPAHHAATPDSPAVPPVAAASSCRAPSAACACVSAPASLPASAAAPPGAIAPEGMAAAADARSLAAALAAARRARTRTIHHHSPRAIMESTKSPHRIDSAMI